MSVDWLSKAWVTETGSVTRKAVLIALADRCGEEGICWPSHGDIQRRTELGRTAVRTALEELEVDGFIETWGRTRPDGSKTSKGYKLVIPEISQGDGRETAMGGRQTAKGGPRDGHRTEPSVEPSSGSSMRRRGATSQQSTRPKGKLQPRESDEAASTDEAPAMGTTPRKSNAAAKEVAAERGVSGFGLALRLQKGLKDRTDSLGIVDVRALAKRLNDLHRAGQSRELQADMIETFASNPSRYTRGDMKGWTAFLAALPKLEADCSKSRRHRGRDENPYANEKIVG